MRILTHVPDGVLGALRAYVAPDTLAEVAGRTPLIAALSAGDVRWLILDPMALAESASEEVLRGVAAAGPRLVLYAASDTNWYPRVLAAQRHTLPEVVVHDRSDADSWRRLIPAVQSPDASVAARVLHASGARLRRVPRHIAHQIAALFTGARIPQSVDDFARTMGLGSGALRAHLRRAGIESPATLLTAARLVRAVPDIASRRESLDRIAEVHKFGCVRSLERAAAQILGAPPRSVGTHFDAGDVATRVVRALTVGEKIDAW